ncbi:exonuclease domain-containing protein [Palleronia sp. THAF1]|uniref:3'-5' exonuclease n=1 Tax=Palleronia sp. THAF1 TaxID=2587842 RepID=UPI000F52395C|nr:exonuclease domain-containing protein [Palleronia sp. THAF1]
MIIFIDFEASSLAPNSWPIEIGLSWIEPDGSITSVGKLIRPAPTWPETAWSDKSAAVHRIPRSDLDGAEPAETVARWAVEAIGDAQLIADAPRFDQHWLDRLLTTMEDAPKLQIEDFHQVAWTAFTDDGNPISAALDAVYEKRERRRTSHRAAKDAADLAHSWRSGLHVLGRLP